MAVRGSLAGIRESLGGPRSILLADLPEHIDWLTVSYGKCTGRPQPDVERVVEVDGWSVVVGHKTIRVSGVELGRWKNVGRSAVVEFSGVGCRLLGPWALLELVGRCLGVAERVGVSRIDLAKQWGSDETDVERFPWFVGVDDMRLNLKMPTAPIKSVTGETRYVDRGGVLVRDYYVYGQHRRFEVQVRLDGKLRGCGSLESQVAVGVAEACMFAAIVAPDARLRPIGFSRSGWREYEGGVSVPEVNARRGAGLMRRYFEAAGELEALQLLKKLEMRVAGGRCAKKWDLGRSAQRAEGPGSEGARGPSPEHAKRFVAGSVSLARMLEVVDEA